MSKMKKFIQGVAEKTKADMNNVVKNTDTEVNLRGGRDGECVSSVVKNTDTESARTNEEVMVGVASDKKAGFMEAIE